MQILPFDFMTWAKLHYFDSELSLVPSGMPWPTSEDLQVPDIAPFEEVGCDGPQTLSEDVARAYGVPLEGVLPCLGSTQAAHLLMTALLDPGDEVLVETPAYGVFACTAALVGARCTQFVRRQEDGFALDPAAIEAAIGPRTKLVVFTTVHNPSGRLASAETLHEIGEICQRHGIWALASEVYLDFLERSTIGPNGEAQQRRPAAAIHPRLFTSKSLTKVFGLGSVRLGWLIGDTAVMERCRTARETLAPVLPALPIAVGREALRRRDHLLGRAHRVASVGRATLNTALASAEGFEGPPPEVGIISFVRVEGIEDTMRFTDYLRAEHGVGASPGEFFGLPGWLRVGYGIAEETITEGWRRLGAGRTAWLQQH